jgi:hypothetical protein
MVGISVEVAVLVGEGVSEAVGVNEGGRVNVSVGVGVCVEVGGVVEVSVTDGGKVKVRVFVSVDPEEESFSTVLHAPSNSARKIERSTNVIRPSTKGLCMHTSIQMDNRGSVPVLKSEPNDHF